MQDEAGVVLYQKTKMCSENDGNISGGYRSQLDEGPTGQV